MNLAQALLHNWNDLPRETVRKGWSALASAATTPFA